MCYKQFTIYNDIYIYMYICPIATSDGRISPGLSFRGAASRQPPAARHAARRFARPGARFLWFRAGEQLIIGLPSGRLT